MKPPTRQQIKKLADATFDNILSKTDDGLAIVYVARYPEDFTDSEPHHSERRVVNRLEYRKLLRRNHIKKDIMLFLNEASVSG